ncbi:hypothetical protein B9G53_03300 [Pseudanabaena sp. SR411]|uniref:beta strand repeat-containing protein n=1 Tax=Pseudanabaena sp. SR411 TaxID=1980935 RepID=UPI000B984B16|nr:filamentous hemagglutinin N-terminal domain-containing protein [Pseudanabaena sp. SR411]OYQ66765.1 hypothetical protein B9G53_03300 [Pseudanabaena sp. SR411]
MIKIKIKVMIIASAFSMISFNFFSQASFGQNAIAPDATLPVNTSVNFNSANNTYTITGGTQVGVNQFHSFQDFSVPTGNTAHFDTAPTTVNAIGRVTGSNVSNIDGILRTNGTTNLYLVNPNGIVFGANAKLDIAGSFSASTANSIKFSDGSEFSATNPQAPPLLNVNVPLGLQYGTSNTGATISNRGNLSAGQDLVLNADQLDLQGTLRSQRDLTLQAQDLVKIRDTSTSPFFAVSGRDLLIQGNQSVDIFTLNHRNSGFWSGGNMVLRSLNPVIGDAHFYAGNNLKIEKLNGSLGNLISPNDPVILANGDVSLGDYTGASLHILAGGSVTLGNVTIDSTGDVATTINPNNTTLFNATKIYADLATFNLTDYQTVLNSDGSVKEILPVQVPIAINGSTQATLDVQSGVDWSQLGGLPTSPTVLGATTASYVDSPARADITVNGNIRISQSGGLVLLTNQFSPSTLQGTISTQGIDTSTIVAGATGGDIRVYGRGDIAINNDPNTSGLSAYSFSFSETAGNGGKIAIASDFGSITLNNSTLNSYSFSINNSSGNGGAISLASNAGNITLNDSTLNSYSFSINNNSGNGGAVSLSANSGNIVLSNSTLSSYSRAYLGKAENGGAISLASNAGDITLNNSTLNSYSDTIDGNSTNGGRISVTSIFGNIAIVSSILNSYSLSPSNNSGYGGGISFSSKFGNITLANSSLSSYSKYFNSLSSMNVGNGGAISFSSGTGDIKLIDTRLESDLISFSFSGDTDKGGNAGSISLTSNSGNITLDNAYLSSSSTVVNGSGGSGIITVANNSGNITLNNSTLRSSSAFRQNGGVVTITNNSGNIALNNSSLDSSSGSRFSSGNGGDISVITKNGNITLDNSKLRASSDSFRGSSGNGGAILVSASSGNINLKSSSLFSFSNADFGTVGNGGQISVNTFSGSIAINDSRLDSFSSSIYGAVGSGGAISIISNSNDISLSNSLFYSHSFSQSSTSSNGGDIFFSAPNSNITSSLVSSTFSFAVSNSGLTSGNGGDVNLVAKNQISNLEIFTLSSAGQAGMANIYGSGDLSISNLQISTSKTINIPNPSNPNVPITLDTGERGRSGDVEISGLGSLTFDQTIINSATQSSDLAGNISITSPSFVTFQNNSQIISNTQSIGNAGNVSVTANQGIIFKDNSKVTATTNAQGKAGDITINAPIVKIYDDSKVLAETNGAGTGGNITINAPTSVDLTRVLDAFPVLSVQTNNAGKAGSIVINTPILTLTDKARITATASTTATNPDGGGSITLNASQMNLFGTVGVFAETQGISPAGTLRLNPYSNLGYINIALAPNSQISASTSSIGNGGDLFVTAPQSIAIAGQGKLAVETTGLMDNAGKAGNITFTTKQLTLTDGVLVSASTSGRGKAGDIFVKADDFTISNGAQIQTATSSIGDSGKIDVRVVNQFNLSGSKTGLFANTLANSTGRGGDIFIDPESVILRDGAQIAVGSLGAGIGGNITLISNFLTLLNGSSITAETASANGGNITLNIPSILLMRYGSQISTTAGTALAGGNGGNINITAGFIVALPKENSDIFANAFTGNGGNINLTTNGIFGLEFRPVLTPLSDITASSQFGVNGTVNINTPGVDPSKGLTNLPVDIGDASKLVTQKCLADRQDSAFVITGRGGIPASPADVISSNNLQENLGTPSSQLASQSSQVMSQSPNKQVNPDRIIEAQGWTINPYGEVSLVAEVPQAIPAPTWAKQLQCR